MNIGEHMKQFGVQILRDEMGPAGGDLYYLVKRDSGTTFRIIEAGQFDYLLSIVQQTIVARSGKEAAQLSVRCKLCNEFYGDNGPCDEGKPLCSPHRQ